MRREIQNLAFVTDAGSFGGAERYIVSMALAARRRGIDPSICWLPWPGTSGDVFDSARKAGIPVHVPGCLLTKSGRLRMFRRFLQTTRPDGLIINASGRPGFWATCWLARYAGLPSVWVQQMVDGQDHRQLPPKWFGGRVEGPQWWRVPQALRHRAAAAAASAVVALNAADRERVARWQGVHRDRIRVVPHGVDCEAFRFDEAARQRLRAAWDLPEADSFVVGTSARLVDGKGVDLLIEATALLRGRGVPAVAVVAGQGPQRETLVDLSRRLGIEHAVRFLGFVEDMPAFCSALDAFVLCSSTESFGLALAEAMSCMRVVVGTPTAGARRQIDHLCNGWQLQGFTSGELADALAVLHADPALCQRLGEQGREDVRRQFSIDLTLERTLRALRGSAGERSRLAWPGMREPFFAGMTAEDVPL